MKTVGILIAVLGAGFIGFIVLAAMSDNSGMPLMSLFAIRNPIVDFGGFWMFVGILVWVGGVIEERIMELRDALKPPAPPPDNLPL